MRVTEEQLKQILPQCSQPRAWAEALSKHLLLWNKENTAMFIAQAGHESTQFNTLEENLNYGTGGLISTFGARRFPGDTAKEYARKPEKIANYVYCNRLGNGPPESGDGYKYRGRGLFQVTGKHNYQKCSLALFGDISTLLDHPELLSTPEYAVKSALWYWQANRLERFLDIEKATRAINGGLNGLDDRKAIYERALKVL